MKRIYLCCLLVISNFSLWAQLVTSDPLFATQKDSITITFNAALGNAALKGYTGVVYAHTGVITNLSTGPSDWKHAPTWGDNSAKYKLTKIGTDLYTFKITPDLNTFYGITAGETVLQLAFVFRSSDKTLQGKTSTGGDIFSPIYAPGLRIYRVQPASNSSILSINSKIIIEAFASSSDSMKLYLADTLNSMIAGKHLIDTITALNPGNNKIKIIAQDSSGFVTDSFSYFVLGSTQQTDVPAGIRDGINYINDSTVILSLLAPYKSYVFVLGDFNNWTPDTAYQMKKSTDSTHYWLKINHLTPGKEYIFQYLVDGQIRIGDPYAEKVSDPWNDSYIDSITYPGMLQYPSNQTTGIATVLQTAKPAYTWRHPVFSPPAKTDLVIYELLVRDFTINHTYKGIIDTLQYLKRLGINAIELMPIMEFEGNLSWGYNPNYYFAPDKYYGPASELKRLIDTCHSQGIAIVLDIVLNHAFGTSPLAMLYWDGTNNRPATNNLWFNPIPKHDYNVGNDFNHESPYTKQYVRRILTHWLQNYKIDGFRFDLSKGFTQKNTLGNTYLWGLYDTSRIAILKNYSDTIWKVNPKAYSILEHFAENKEEQELVKDGMMVWDNCNYNYSQAGMGYQGSNSDFSWGSYLYRSLNNPGAVTYMESHDEERIMYNMFASGNNQYPNYLIRNNLNVDLIRDELCAAFFFTVPGPKMIWQFGETGYDYSINNNGRTGNKPIRWDYNSNPNRQRLYQVYSSLIHLKKTYDSFRSSDYTTSFADSIKTLYISNSSMDVRIVGNFTENVQKKDVSFSFPGVWYDYMTGDTLIVPYTLTRNISLDKSEYHIYVGASVTPPDIIFAPKARQVKITGSTWVGQQLTGGYTYFQQNNVPEGISTYKWYRGLSKSGAGKIAIGGATSINYMVTSTDKGYYLFFEVTPVAQMVNLPIGIPEISSIQQSIIASVPISKSSEFICYPNPFNSSFTLVLPDGERSNWSVEIINNMGQVVKTIENKGQFPGEEINIDGSGLQPGIYFCRLRMNEKVYVQRMIKQ